MKYFEDFYSAFPFAPKDHNGMPLMKACQLYLIGAYSSCPKNKDDKCDKCWTEDIPDFTLAAILVKRVYLKDNICSTFADHFYNNMPYALGARDKKPRFECCHVYGHKKDCSFIFVNDGCEDCWTSKFFLGR